MGRIGPADPQLEKRRFGVDAAGEMLLPGPDARLAPTTFDAWLTTDTRKARARSDRTAHSEQRS